MENIQLYIVEDRPVIRESLTKYFGAHPAIELQLVAKSIEDSLSKLFYFRIYRLILCS